MESIEFLNTFFSLFNGTWAFGISALSVFAAFIVCLMLSALKTGYGLKKRAWYVAVSAFFCAFLKARASFTGERDLSSVLLCFALILLVPICLIPEKKEKADNAAEDGARRRLIRFLDKELKNGPTVSDNAYAFHTEKIIAQPQPEQERKPNVDEDLDFSHVKNVLSRLEPALLSYSDRRQIHDLEIALYDAERGGVSEETRGRINEGLGNLLKIMAKHGV